MSELGLLIRAHGGFFDVETEKGNTVRCRARGRLHLENTEPIPGDRVRWEPDGDYGVVIGIEPRKNVFIRPNMANLEQLIYVASAARPVTDPYLIDTMSVVAGEADCNFILCVNKIDLDSGDSLCASYSGCNFPVIRVSAETGFGIETLRETLKGRISAFTGNSGVGKTSLLNLLLPGVDRNVAEISAKRGRGRHTTRLTELFPLPDSGYIADTPGFAALEFNRLSDMEDIARYFAEFPVGECRFPDCIHRAEPDCAVRRAVDEGTVAASRYQSYLRMLQEKN